MATTGAAAAGFEGIPRRAAAAEKVFGIFAWTTEPTARRIGLPFTFWTTDTATFLLVVLRLPLAIWLAAVCYSLEKARKQSTETTTESMDAFSFLSHESAACANFKRTHRRGAEDERKMFLIKKYSEFSELCVSVVKYRFFLTCDPIFHPPMSEVMCRSR